jgi:hypothetical protein
MHFLLDANVTAGYYLPDSLKNKRAVRRIQAIIDATRTKKRNDFFFIPNFCIAEVISTFTKYAYGKWNRHLEGKHTLDKRVFQSLVGQFHKDIHNGKVLYHCELNRYHLLTSHVITPIDHYFKISKGSDNVNPAGTIDHLIVGMAIQLGRIHGPQNICVLTADNRLAAILDRCKKPITEGTRDKLKLDIFEDIAGIKLQPEIVPLHLNLGHARETDIEQVIDGWPIQAITPKGIYRWLGD